jgi:CRISPR-associated endonuclease/helicase Cas3
MNSNPLLAHPHQSLAKHLAGVARRAREFARHFGGEQHAELAGLLHDLGKADESFRKRMEAIKDKGKDPGGKQPHAPHGASLLLEPPENRGGPVWPAAFAVLGHHAGLHNRSDLKKCLRWRDKALKFIAELPADDPDWNGVRWPIADFGKNLPEWLDALPNATPEERAAKFRAVDLYTRFLFSALIDADRLDTEEHDPETKDNFAKRHNWRFGQDALAAGHAPAQLLAQLNEAIQKRKKAAEEKGASPDVLRVRADVLEACAAAAGKPRGIFTFTVPTGGGKTLASVFFALNHIAAQNQHPSEPRRKLRRIIIVIPFLNIIHQTALELRKVFGDLVWKKDEIDPLTGRKSLDPDTGEEGAWVENDAPGHLPLVLEHHSQAQDPPLDDKKAEESKASDYSRERTLRQLAAENWAAPIVVTTSVQFFDSLFSRRPADARKLHNIAQSVVIFDEVQTFPPRLMQPILDALQELSAPLPDPAETDPAKRAKQRPYGCSPVLCTATQPALVKAGAQDDDLPWAFPRDRVTEIVPDARSMFDRLKRTRYPELESKGDIPRKTWPELAAEVLHARDTQGLVVVNTRRHARAFFEELRKSDEHKNAVFHLSTWMTPAHRLEVLADVRRRLEKNEPCFLVSTQCIEAGVDVDFPAVWRALGPYDAIVQAAGRCNRNGGLKDSNGHPILGEVHVFRPEDDALPPGVYQTATNQTELLRRMAAADPHDPESFKTYFRLLYQLSVPDECEIQQGREQLRFEQVSTLFNFIESFTVPIIVAEYDLADGRVAIRQKCEDAARKGFFTPEEWRQIQPHIVQLDYRDKKTARFNKDNTVTMFKEDDHLTGLRRLTHFSAYTGGLHGCGLDVDQLGSFETLL